ncbi:hypothetical protein ANCDUO_02077 [Ancylostoma duodenale]|uniref:Uncharacterized protein n=1 Tax=Ancylostoma duodenale TaxID=51022 RepID=A0A0C2HDH3_9BILA|nr:hypothetical protein ANCDUO_02077 [Ancylostoma duodenale]
MKGLLALGRKILMPQQLDPDDNQLQFGRIDFEAMDTVQVIAEMARKYLESSDSGVGRVADVLWNPQHHL